MHARAVRLPLADLLRFGWIFHVIDRKTAAIVGGTALALRLHD